MPFAGFASCKREYNLKYQVGGREMFRLLLHVPSSSQGKVCTLPKVFPLENGKQVRKKKCARLITGNLKGGTSGRTPSLPVPSLSGVSIY